MKRRKAREYALQFLYGIGFIQKSGNIDPKEIRDELYIFWTEAGVKDLDIREFAEEIITGTLANLETIDSTIQSAAENWKLDRMSSVDRNILRFAAYELLFDRTIPPAVTINEAIEIAKAFSTLESSSFINGILDKILKNLTNPKEKF